MCRVAVIQRSKSCNFQEEPCKLTLAVSQAEHGPGAMCSAQVHMHLLSVIGPLSSMQVELAELEVKHAKVMVTVFAG